MFTTMFFDEVFSVSTSSDSWCEDNEDDDAAEMLASWAIRSL